jgi:hypothetical protein
MRKHQENESLTESEIAARMNRAIRKSFELPPKPHKEMRYPRKRKPKISPAEKLEIPSE